MPWIIDRDVHPTGPPGTPQNAKGVHSVRWDPAKDPVRAKYQFRMKDDDGIVYYYGRSTTDKSFAPLDDFGAPNAGCTSIEYLNRKAEWEVL